MRRQGPITMRHMIVAVLVMVVINAQLTWWVVFILRLNRTILAFERQRLLGAVQIEAVRIQSDLESARTALAAAVLMGDEPGRSAVPKPFVGWRAAFGVDDCRLAILNSSGVVELSVESGLVCVTGVIAGAWSQEMLDVGAELEAVAAGADGPPGVSLAEPYDGLAIRPRPEVWQAMLDSYRRRIVMLVSEGAFFAVLLLVLIGLLWRSFRREVELERQHRNFMSAVTHELKSPLASMRLALETVASGRASPEAGNRFINNAIEDSERLQDLVQKVLETTRFGEGWTEIHPQDTDLSGLVEDSIEGFRRRALAAGARMEATIAPNIRAEVDAEAMAIVVSNLLENAVKYGGKPPRVEVDLSFDGTHAILEIADNGSGIPDEDLELIFGRFYRGGDEMTRTTRGTGLGLYLVQQIIEAHRSRIGVSSTGPEGTVFRVTLPGSQV
jgi:two-component system phosphate regulon sensor histidine kinase PhoR